MGAEDAVGGVGGVVVAVGMGATAGVTSFSLMPIPCQNDFDMNRRCFSYLSMGGVDILYEDA
jgi:hypothetical protein